MRKHENEEQELDYLRRAWNVVEIKHVGLHVYHVQDLVEYDIERVLSNRGRCLVVLYPHDVVFAVESDECGDGGGTVRIGT